MVVEPPSRPINVRVKDVWSRSASITWSSPFAGNSPITNYVIQFWRKATNEAGQPIQNHRRQELTVSGTQTSALITNLMPALQYEASVMAENQVGRGEASDNVLINTGEDEPSSPPADVSAEARGPSTIKVSWKVPPSDSWNGKLRGFNVGFRPRVNPNTIDVQSLPGLTSGFSYRTIEYVSGQQAYEAFLTNLVRGQEYDITVKAFNGIGSSPDSHLMSVRTYDGDLPASPNLFAHHASHSSIALRWTYPSRAQSSANSLRRYVIYYQRQGDDSWLEIGIPIEDQQQQQRLRSGSSNQIDNVSQMESGSHSYQLTGLDPGSVYKIYVVAVNNFGMGDPSNFVTTKTEQLNGGVFGDGALVGGNSLGEMNFNTWRQQVVYVMAVPIICTIILVVVIMSVVFYCTKRMQGPTSHLMTANNQFQATSQAGPRGSGMDGTMPATMGTQRYLEFDKGGILKNNNNNNALLVGTTQSSEQSSQHQLGNGQAYQLPYGTMPMNSVVISDQKSWDRQSGPLKPLMNHIYDSPI